MVAFDVLLLVAMSASLMQRGGSELTATDRRRIDEAVRAAMDRGAIPGVAVAVVNRTSALLEAGYGLANVSSGRPMTADTLLPLGSTTKAFTTALLAILIDEHATQSVQFNWTTPLCDLLGPTFQLYDQQLTSETTLEDILSHRTGIPDYFLLLLAGYPYHVTRQQLIQSLRYHKPVLPFRQEYAYNNHLYVLAGYVAEVLEGRPWEQLTSEYLLQPLGMTSTTYVSEVLVTSPDNMAASCGWTEHGCAPVDIQLLDQVNIAAPAGALVSTARDMSRWMQWHLSGGTVPAPRRRRLIDKDDLWETYRARNPAFGRHMDERGTRSTEQHVAYDLGWMTSYYRGKRRVWHSGSISTYKAHVWLYPDAGLGIFAALAGPQRYDTTDVFIDLMHAISDVVVFDDRPTPAADQPPTSPQPDHGVARPASVAPRPLDDYVGLYVGQWLEINAIVTYERVRGTLRFTLGRMLTAELRQYDCIDQEFDAVIDGRLWWVAEGAPQRATMPVKFWSTVAGSRPDVLELPLESEVGMGPVRRLRFTRPGLLLPDDWSPPRNDVDNEDSCSAAITATLHGLNTWLCCTVILRLFVYF